MTPARTPSRRLALVAAAVTLAALTPAAAAPASGALSYQVKEGLNANAFLQDGPVAAHLLLRDGRDPRILFAFPAGNSGVGLWFERVGTDAAWTLTRPPQPVARSDAKGRPLRGAVAEATVTAPELKVRQAVLSSVRVLRDYQALGRLPEGIATAPTTHGDTLTWARDRLDGAAGYSLSVQVIHGALRDGRIVAGADGRIGLRVTGLTGERPLTPFPPGGLLDGRAAPDPSARRALTFLSYREKFLAGSWRFDTYFGRDTLMSVRLLMPALRPEAVETGLASVLARLSPQGEVAHEEDIGEFAVLDHMRRDGTRSDAPVYDYKMIDSSFLLAPVARAWLLDDPRAKPRAAAFLSAPSGERGADAGGAARRGDALVTNLRLVLKEAAPFAADPRAANLIALKPGVPVGEWRDSDTGLGGGRYPYDVNAVLVPAALEAAGRLYASGLLDPYLRQKDRADFARAAAVARVWRERAPSLFAVQVDPAEAARNVSSYADALGAPAGPAAAAVRDSGARFFALSLDAGSRPIPVMNSDLGFELLFGEPQDARALAMRVRDLMRPFPAGLMTGVGMVVANAAYAPAGLQPEFTPQAYHGAVVWSWQQALFAAGLARQLGRTDLPADARAELRRAQATLWSAIRATPQMSNSELWSWAYADGRWRVAPFGASGGDADESNAAQLWSTVYLAVQPPAAARGK